MATTEYAATACAENMKSLFKLGERVTDEQWGRQTECPEWTVGDVFGHIAHVESWLADGSHEFDGPTQDWINAEVVARRSGSRETVLAELGAALPIRYEQLASPAETTFLPFHKAMVPMDLALTLRAFDLYTHEQDIRRAIGRPGNLGSRSGFAVVDLLIQALPRLVVKEAGAPPGSTVRFSALGEYSVDVAVQVDEDGRGAMAVPGAAPARRTTHLMFSWEGLARLTAGRGRAEHEVLVTGDRALADRILANINLAP